MKTLGYVNVLTKLIALKKLNSSNDVLWKIFKDDFDWMWSMGFGKTYKEWSTKAV